MNLILVSAHANAPVTEATTPPPFVNSLGIEFVPVPGTETLFCRWETRVKDFQRFAAANKVEVKRSDFPQTDTDPVVNVTWEEANAFCVWLSKEEGRQYRLPTDVEWSMAVGLPVEKGATPQERQLKVLDAYPWGMAWPPPKGAGNYHPNLKTDDFKCTSPVGSFSANSLGICDLGGNVWEWCEDEYRPGEGPRVLRGGSWADDERERLLTTRRRDVRSGHRHDRDGFRCVVVSAPSPSRGGAPAANPAPPPSLAPFDARQARASQEAWARHLGRSVESTNSLGVSLVLIPPGEFLMGSTDEQVADALNLAASLGIDENTRKRIRETERPQRSVTIDQPFLLGVTEVTIGQFRKFASETHYVTEAEVYGNGNASDPRPAAAADKNGFDWHFPGYNQTEDDAVSQVTWNDAVAFCNWLSMSEKLEPAYTRDLTNCWELVSHSNGYCLPTEAQWEYACRAGTTTHYSFGDDPGQLEKHGWFALKSGSTPVRRVGSKPVNPFGLYDMHGNLFEWCYDIFGPQRSGKSLPEIPGDLRSNAVRVIRGGDWFGNALRCRSAFRGLGAQTTRSDDVGFRLLRPL